MAEEVELDDLDPHAGFFEWVPPPTMPSYPIVSEMVRYDRNLAFRVHGELVDQPLDKVDAT